MRSINMTGGIKVLILFAAVDIVGQEKFEFEKYYTTNVVDQSNAVKQVKK